jgi:hypothetical protein
MSEAALTEDTEQSNSFDLDQDQSQETQNVEVEQTESATVVDEAPKEDGFQKRINKVTADKYAEKRRADDLQRKIDEMQAAPKAAAKAPTLEDFDHDEEAYNSASIKHQVSEAVKAEREALKVEAQQGTAAEAQRAFNERIVAMNKPDFAEVANAVPQLPAGVADALVQSENGADLIYHLGTHLDMADKLANMSPTQAIMELGRISGNMSAKPEQKLSAAPDPIEPISSGGSISSEKGPTGATYE